MPETRPGPTATCQDRHRRSTMPRHRRGIAPRPSPRATILAHRVIRCSSSLFAALAAGRSADVRDRGLHAARGRASGSERAAADGRGPGPPRPGRSRHPLQRTGRAGADAAVDHRTRDRASADGLGRRAARAGGQRRGLQLYRAECGAARAGSRAADRLGFGDHPARLCACTGWISPSSCAACSPSRSTMHAKVG